ncbi:MAG: hypothetical protein RL701_4938 [Pseudomonadota bacterium]|jgi:hypothetical protein
MYRARGLVFLGAREYYEKFVPGGALAVTQALDAETAEYFAQIFLGSAMYDLLPIVKITAAAAQIAELPQMELVKRNSAWQAEHDLRGVYKMFVRALPPDAVAVRLPKLALKYFEFGESDARMQSERLCLGEMRGIPVELSHWLQSCMLGYIPVALGVAGAKNVRVRTTEDTKPGTANGLVAISTEVRWS